MKFGGKIPFDEINKLMMALRDTSTVSKNMSVNVQIFWFFKKKFIKYEESGISLKAIIIFFISHHTIYPGFD